MTPLMLQKELKEALEECLSDLRFKNTRGEDVPITVYRQAIPIKLDDSDDEPFPYIEIRITEGRISGDSENNTIHVWIIVGTFNDNTSNYGADDVLGIMQRIVERLCKNNTVRHFRLAGVINWTTQNTESYPYYFGGMEMDFLGIPFTHQSTENSYT